MIQFSHVFGFLKKAALSIGIIIALNVFFNAGLRTFYPMPEYESFCEDVYPKGQTVETQVFCEENGGAWMNGYCDYTKDCYDAFNQAQQEYRLAGFVILSVAGFFSLMLGLFAHMPSAVANGFMWGGVLSMLIGTAGYWSNMQNWLQLTVSGAILILLVGIGAWKLKD